MHEWFVGNADCPEVPLTELGLCWSSPLTAGMPCVGLAPSRQGQQASSSWSCPLHRVGVNTNQRVASNQLGTPEPPADSLRHPTH